MKNSLTFMLFDHFNILPSCVSSIMNNIKNCCLNLDIA